MIKHEGDRRNLERRGYSNNTKHAKEFKYYICGCGAFGCTYQKGEMKLSCKECGEDCFLLFNAPKISNVFHCVDCNSEWISSALYKNWSTCKNCKRDVWPTRFYFNEFYPTVNKISELVRRNFVEYSDYGGSFNLLQDKLYYDVVEIAKKIYF